MLHTGINNYNNANRMKPECSIEYFCRKNQILARQISATDIVQIAVKIASSNRYYVPDDGE